MHRYSFVVVLVTSACLPCSVAQAPSAGQDFSYTISTSQPWTDTGLDLDSGDVLQISARGADAAVPDRHAVSGTAGCGPQGVSEAAQASDLPLPSAAAGALIARLHAQGAAPILIGASHELRIEEPGHLFLGVNASDAPPCQGSFSVKVHLTSAQTQAQAASQLSATAQAPAPAGKSLAPSSSSASAAAPTAPNQKPADLKQKLAAAAQTWLGGQFGTGGSSAASSPGLAANAPPPGNAPASGNAPSNAPAAGAAPALSTSTAALDPALRKDIDGMPRRVNDQYNNLGDMVNFVLIGSQQQVQGALDAANWHVADTDTKQAALKAVLETYEKKDYLQMPMSKLMLFGRFQDYGYEMAEPIAMVASRHHFRIWKAPFTYNGQTVWVGAGTHDIGFEKDQRNGKVTHKIDPAVDGERDNIGSSLQKSGKAKSLAYYLPPNPVQDARNATGGGYYSDGRILVILLQ